MALHAAAGLLERQRELQTLADAARAACSGAGGAALIEAGAGLGKTTLLGAAMRDAGGLGMSVLHARATELEGDFAWGVVRQLFDPRVGRAPASERAELLGEAAGLAAPALGLDAAAIAENESPFAALHGLYWLTANLAQRGPVMLVIDDLHWADGPSLRFVAHLVPRLAELAVLVLLANRPALAHGAADPRLLRAIAAQPGVAMLRPGALSAAATAAFVRAEVDPAATDDLCDACHEVTAGNPFLLRELSAELIEREMEVGPEAIDAVRRIGPAGVSRRALSRLTQMAAGAPALARAVAVLGGGASLHRAGVLAGLEPAAAAQTAARLIRAEVLVDEEPLAFRHPIVGSAVYRELSGPERSDWNRRAAQLLVDEGGPLEQVAGHLLTTLPGNDPWTVARLQEAAEQARREGAPEIAVAHLRRALAEPPAPPARVGVLFDLGRAEATHAPGAACVHLAEALAATPPGPRRAEIALALGNALIACGAVPRATEVLDRALGELPGGPSRSRAVLEAALVVAARHDVGRPQRHREVVGRLRDRVGAGELLHPRLCAELAIEAKAAGTHRDQAVHHARSALAVAGKLSDAAALVPELIAVLTFADVADEAQATADAWLALMRRRGRPFAAALASLAASSAALRRGAISDALASAQDAISVDVGFWVQPLALALRVEALIELDQLDVAHAELAGAALDGELARTWPSIPLLRVRGRLYAAGGRHEAAVADLLLSGELGTAAGVLNPAMHPWRSGVAVSLAMVGRGDAAAKLAAEEVTLARRWGAPRAIGVALRARGLVTPGVSGHRLLRQATAVLDGSPAPLEHARALTDLGAALRRAGQRVEAREHLRHGLDLAHRLGGVALAARAREELQIAGGRPRRDALRGRDALTPSELRVARLAAAGHGNRQIAQALFVTQRTVELHLTSTYAKLGIASRDALSAALDAATQRTR